MDILTRNTQHLGASEHRSDQERNEKLVAFAQWITSLSGFLPLDFLAGPVNLEGFGSPKLERQYHNGSSPEGLALIKHVHLHGGRNLMHSNSGGMKMGIP
jgi:hypothetical protein